jgi:hydrogenase maturation factor HypF (carbamoyltransferase family)
LLVKKDSSYVSWGRAKEKGDKKEGATYSLAVFFVSHVGPQPVRRSRGYVPFDAVAAMVDLRGEVTYEAQAAIELEAVSYQAVGDRMTYPFALVGEEVKVGPLLAQVVIDVQTGLSPGIIGQRFHQTLAEVIQFVCSQVRERERD